MKYFYKTTKKTNNHSIYVVGYEDKNGNWYEDSTYYDKKKAVRRTAFLNGASREEQLIEMLFNFQKELEAALYEVRDNLPEDMIKVDHKSQTEWAPVLKPIWSVLAEMPETKQMVEHIFYVPTKEESERGRKELEELSRRLRNLTQGSETDLPEDLRPGNQNN